MKIKGYMTVEASLVLPMVFGVIVFVICLLFYSYDRCLLEQDMSALVVRSGYLPGDTLKERLASMEGEVQDLYVEKYVWIDVAVQELVMKDAGISIAAAGTFRGPFFESAAAKRQIYSLSPTFFLRQKIKLEKNSEDLEESDEYGVY